jgi:hypothetical protein
MAKWPNHFISGKLFQKRQNWADLAFLKAKWQPCPERLLALAPLLPAPPPAYQGRPKIVFFDAHD